MDANNLSNMFPLVSKRHLSAILGCQFAYLENVAQKAGSYYRPCEILIKEKRRHIDKPVGELKLIQKLILRKILYTIPLPLTMIGGVVGCSTKQNASSHVGQPQVVTLDLRDCFPKTNDRKIFAVYKKYKCSNEVADVLTKLTTFQHRLPQGAPTSSMLANLVLLPLHDEIQALTTELGLIFTMYVDDITISGLNAKNAISPVIDLIHKYGYGVRRPKIRCVPANSQQIVTGLVVNNKVAVPKQKRQEIIRRILTLSNMAKVEKQEIRSLLGIITYVKSISLKTGTHLESLAKKLLQKHLTLF